MSTAATSSWPLGVLGGAEAACDDGVVGQASAYRLDELGWLQLERLCDLVLEKEAGLTELVWRGHADRGRVALADDDVVLEAYRERSGFTRADVDRVLSDL